MRPAEEMHAAAAKLRESDLPFREPLAKWMDMVAGGWEMAPGVFAIAHEAHPGLAVARLVNGGEVVHSRNGVTALAWPIDPINDEAAPVAPGAAPNPHEGDHHV